MYGICRDYVRGGSEGALAPPPPGILGFREENRERNRQSITNSPTGIKILTWSLYSIHKPKLSYPKPDKKASKIKAIESGIILLIDQVAAVMFVKKTNVSDFGTSERFLCQFPKPFHEFELLPGAAQW